MLGAERSFVQYPLDKCSYFKLMMFLKFPVQHSQFQFNIGSFFLTLLTCKTSIPQNPFASDNFIPLFHFIFSFLFFFFFGAEREGIDAGMENMKISERKGRNKRIEL